MRPLARHLVAVVLALWFTVAAAADVPRDPFAALSLRQYAAVLAMTLLGGFVGWYTKVRKGEVKASNLFALIGEMATSALSGWAAFFICDHFAVPLGMTAAVCGMAGYMGGRLIDRAERLVQQHIDRKFGQTGPAPLDDGDRR